MQHAAMRCYRPFRAVMSRLTMQDTHRNKTMQIPKTTPFLVVTVGRDTQSRTREGAVLFISCQLQTL
jgi:hypothetical protein